MFIEVWEEVKGTVKIFDKYEKIEGYKAQWKEGKDTFEIFYRGSFCLEGVIFPGETFEEKAERDILTLIEAKDAED